MPVPQFADLTLSDGAVPTCVSQNRCSTPAATPLIFNPDLSIDHGEEAGITDYRLQRGTEQYSSKNGNTRGGKCGSWPLEELKFLVRFPIHKCCEK